MLHRLLAVLIGGFAAIAFAQIASAADLPRKAPAYAPPPDPVYNWTGWYVGLNAGGGWGNKGIDNTVTSSFCNTALGGCTPGLNEFSTALVAAVPRSFDTNGSGFIGGGQIGYNWQTGQVVYGLEADFQGTNIKGSASNGGSAVPTGFAIFTVNTAGTASQNLNFLGTLRGRLGWTPSNPWLLYVTGGLAYGHVETSVAFTENITVLGLPNPSSFASSDQWRAGWTVGGGLEWMLNQHWTIRGEYLYYDLGSVTVNNSMTQLNGAGVPFIAVSIASEAQFKGSIAKAGVNYKF
jgi:outer membrane immunogenic protein